VIPDPARTVSKDRVNCPAPSRIRDLNRWCSRVVFAESRHRVAGGLGGPRPGRVGGDAGEVHRAGGVFDDEQDVEPVQERGVDAGEVGRDDSVRL